MPLRIVALDHVQLAMPAGGEALARRFYRDALGLIEITKPPALAARGGCWFRGPGFDVHLGVEDGFSPARKAHPAFRVGDLAGAVQALAAVGIAATPDDSVPGVRRCHLFDPFGNRIELIQEGEGFAQASDAPMGS